METYEIKGFPDYTIDERMEVVSLKYGKRRVIKGNGVSVLLHRDGRMYSFCRTKLLYAALHRLDPSMIDGSRFIVHNENGRIVVDEKADFRRKIAEKTNRRPVFSKEDAIRRYEEQKVFIDATMEYLRTGNGREMTALLYACREDAVRWIACNYFGGRRESAWSFVDMAIEKVIEGIGNGTVLVNSLPAVCVRNIAKKMVFSCRRQRRTTVQYDDGKWKKGIQDNL